MTALSQTRRQFIIGGSIAVAQVVSGCSPALWREDKYQVEVSDVFISEDGKKLVVITQKYHYIFNAPSYFLDSVRGSLHEFIHAGFGKFVVKSDNTISGEFTLWIEGNAPQLLKNHALEIGYRHQTSGDGVYASGALNGTRFSAPDVVEQNPSVKLNRSYKIDVEVEHSNGERVADILLSPVRIVGGGVLLVGTVVLIPVAFTVQCMRGCK